MNDTIQQIKVLALDVDGVLTDGSISYSTTTSKEIKTFNVHDGLGITLWQKAGFHVVLISGRNAQCVAIRAKELGVAHVFQGSKDKIADLQTCLASIGATLQETAFVGDDLIDIAVMQEVGYAIAVNNAAHEVKEIAHWVTPRDGGKGAVRDAIEHLMKCSDTWETAVTSLQKSTAVQ